LVSTIDSDEAGLTKLKVGVGDSTTLVVGAAFPKEKLSGAGGVGIFSLVFDELPKAKESFVSSVDFEAGPPKLNKLLEVSFFSTG